MLLCQWFNDAEPVIRSAVGTVNQDDRLALTQVVILDAVVINFDGLEFKRSRW